MFLVNEVTYPSSYFPLRDCTYPLMLDAYKYSALDILEPRSVAEPLLQRIEVPYEVFVETADYNNMEDNYSQEEWDFMIKRYMDKNGYYDFGDKESQDDNEIPRPYHVVNASEGGWPPSLLSGPFQPKEEVYCHSNRNNCLTGEGVDHLFTDRRLWCDVGEMLDDGIVHVYCEEDQDDDGRVIPMECCERSLLGDTSIYSTPHGHIHYATSGSDPRTVIEGMRRLESAYEDRLQSLESDETPLLLYYRHIVESTGENEKYLVDPNVPLRIQKSSQYRAHRALLKETSDLLENKHAVAMRTEKLGLNAKGGPFPVTYFSCEDALHAVADASAQFYIKPSFAAWGEGIQVKTRAELSTMLETDECGFGDDDVIIQEGITDHALIGGRRFDIRFYVLVHAGRVYRHQNSMAKWTHGPAYNASSTEEASAFTQKYLSDQVVIFAFLTNRSVGKGKQWLDAIHAQLAAALPAMAPVIDATGVEDTNLFHIFGVDAMIRENGEAVVTEFNDWPSVDWVRGQVTTLDENGQENGERSTTRGRAMYEEVVSTMFADFFAIVLGLADTGTCLESSSDDAQSCRPILEGRVREVISTVSRRRIWESIGRTI
jgi:hypothetical protein